METEKFLLILYKDILSLNKTVTVWKPFYLFLFFTFQPPLNKTVTVWKHSNKNF